MWHNQSRAAYEKAINNLTEQTIELANRVAQLERDLETERRRNYNDVRREEESIDRSGGAQHHMAVKHKKEVDDKVGTITRGKIVTIKKEVDDELAL
jgi:vacuolar-type H+-ATPase subunit D/Vma8